MEFVKLEDIESFLKELDKSLDDMTGDDVYESIKYWLELSAKKYCAEYKAHMPIRIRDYTGDKPVEYDCGEDLKHHRLVIGAGGELGFYNPQEQAFSCNLNYAKTVRECCFIPTNNSEREKGRYSRNEDYIKPEQWLVLKEVKDESV